MCFLNKILCFSLLSPWVISCAHIPKDDGSPSFEAQLALHLQSHPLPDKGDSSLHIQLIDPDIVQKNHHLTSMVGHFLIQSSRWQLVCAGFDLGFRDDRRPLILRSFRRADTGWEEDPSLRDLHFSFDPSQLAAFTVYATHFDVSRDQSAAFLAYDLRSKDPHSAQQVILTLQVDQGPLLLKLAAVAPHLNPPDPQKVQKPLRLRLEQLSPLEKSPLNPTLVSSQLALDANAPLAEPPLFIWNQGQHHQLAINSNAKMSWQRHPNKMRLGLEQSAPDQPLMVLFGQEMETISRLALWQWKRPECESHGFVDYNITVGALQNSFAEYYQCHQSAFNRSHRDHLFVNGFTGEQPSRAAIPHRFDLSPTGTISPWMKLTWKHNGVSSIYFRFNKYTPYLWLPMPRDLEAPAAIELSELSGLNTISLHSIHQDKFVGDVDSFEELRSQRRASSEILLSALPGQEAMPPMAIKQAFQTMGKIGSNSMVSWIQNPSQETADKDKPSIQGLHWQDPNNGFAVAAWGVDSKLGNDLNETLEEQRPKDPVLRFAEFVRRTSPHTQIHTLCPPSSMSWSAYKTYVEVLQPDAIDLRDCSSQALYLSSLIKLSKELSHELRPHQLGLILPDDVGGPRGQALDAVARGDGESSSTPERTAH